MKLTEFRVRNFRSVNDSGPVRVADRTALLGRNESGKTNLLLGLHSLNTPDGVLKLNPVKDYPRDKALNECNDYTPVLDTTWMLSPEEQTELGKVWPRAAAIKSVSISRKYGTTLSVGFEGLKPLKFDAKSAAVHVAKLAACENAEIQKTASALPTAEHSQDWATKATTAVKNIRRIVEAQKVDLNGGTKALADLEEVATAVLRDEEMYAAARNWAAENMPVFMYLMDYPELDGHMDIQALVDRKTNNRLAEGDDNFLKLLQVAGLDLDEIHALLTKDHEKRQQLANRAGAVITKKLKELWKDRALKVRFNLDGKHFDTLISDPTAPYDVEVNLNERSRGFQWFFAFYVTFAADTDGGPAEDAVLLLDEPGLYLHAVAQRDLLNHFANDFKNQILYTTHSPFMVPIADLGSVRTVNISQENGTMVSNEPTGDTRTLFPLQAALGYDVAQTLFLGKRHLLVEGVTDFWFLNAIGNYLQDLGKPTLPNDAVITPCGAASKVPYMVALLGSDKLPVVALFDADKEGRTVSKELLKMKLLEERAVMFVSEALGEDREADIEDLLDPATYEALVKESYASELKGKTLKPNANIPRIAVRMENAFEALGLTFHKTRPANLFIRRMGEKPESVLKGTTSANFELLFKIINAKLNKAPLPFKA